MTAVNPDRLPAEVRAQIAVQTTPDTFALESPEPTGKAPAVELISTLLARGWTKTRIAREIGRDPAQTTRIAQGKQTPSQETHKRLVALVEFGTRPDAPIAPDTGASVEPTRCAATVDLFEPAESLIGDPAPDPLSHLPDAMRPARRWLVWKLIPNPDPAKKGRKVPFYCNGSLRNGTLDTPEDRAQLVTLAEARAALETGAYTGLGFALGPDENGHHWQGIDLDGTDTRSELAALVDRLPGYVERSPSGKGWHAIGIGRDFATLGSNTSGIEAYAHGRYFTVTGTDGRGDLEDIADFVTVTLSPLHSPRTKAKDTPIERPHVDTTDQMVRDLRSALASMRSDDRDLWVRMGLALKSLGDQGRALWLEWSQTSEKFDPGDASRVWESFKPEGTGPAAVFAEAQRSGWINPAKRERKTDTRRPIEREQDQEPEADTAPPGHTPPPWFGKIPPSGWKLTRKLVFEVKEKQGDTPDEYIPVCAPLWVVGLTNGAHGDWGMVLGFLDRDGREQRLAIPAERLHADPAALVQDLARMGLYADPGKHKKILAYLAAWDVDERILSAKRLGWLEDPTGALAFVMPDHVIGRDGNRELVYQPDRYSPTVKTVHAAGSLVQWQAHVGAPACAHPPMLFALCAGLAPPLLTFAEGADSFIMNFWGRTSKGKTALAQLAASPWGCAADPADAPSLAFIRRWNLTGNGLEGLAEAHSDLPLVLDELGAATVGDIRPLVYQLAGGQGKTAMNSAREMREPRSWRTIAISTGEMSLHARMSDPDQDGKRQRTIMGGLTHRALDVEVADIAAAAPKEEREALVSGLKQACARFYGTAGPEFVRRLAARFGTMADARAHVRALVEVILGEIAAPELPTETRRALRRFALIAAAGELASDLGILPADRDEIRSAARTMAASWLSASAETDEQRIIASVRGFILAHESRFQRINEADEDEAPVNPYSRKPPPRRLDEPVRDRVGFVDHEAGRWMFTDAGLVEAAPGHDKTTIARTLKAAGYLYTNEGKLQERVTIGSTRPRLYSVKASILDGAEKNSDHTKRGGQGGHGGRAQQPQGLEPVHHAETRGGQGGQSKVDSTSDEVDARPTVHSVHPSTREGGQASDRAVTGSVHHVHHVHPENIDPQKNPTGDIAAMGDDVEKF